MAGPIMREGAFNVLRRVLLRRRSGAGGVCFLETSWGGRDGIECVCAKRLSAESTASVDATMP